MGDSFDIAHGDYGPKLLNKVFAATRVALRIFVTGLAEISRLQLLGKAQYDGLGRV